MNRTRTFMLLLYPDNEKHLNILNRVENSNLQYAYILHNNDIDEQSNLLKKDHIHLVLYFESARTLTAVQDDFSELEPYFIQPSSYLKEALLYLIHYHQIDKCQYDLDNVIGPLSENLNKLVKHCNISEDNVIREILDFINKKNRYIYFTELYYFVLQNNYWSYYRRSHIALEKYLNEHNQNYHKK